jgi:hypothetical protein
MVDPAFAKAASKHVAANKQRSPYWLRYIVSMQSHLQQRVEEGSSEQISAFSKRKKRY